MTLQNLSALLPGFSLQAGTAARDGGLGAAAEAGGWAEILAGFGSLNAALPDASGQTPQAWAESLDNLKARLDQSDVPPDLAAQFQSLFAWLESEMPAADATGNALMPDPELAAGQAGSQLPQYQGEFWPAPGEMILLLQGISPWGETLQPEQAAWVERVGPFLGIPEPNRTYQGSTVLGREMTAVNLAAAAGGDVQRAFVDAWLGRHDAQSTRAAYEQRWAAGTPVAVGRAAEWLAMGQEMLAGGRDSALDLGRGLALEGALKGGFVPDQREIPGGLVRTDVAVAQAPAGAAARDFGPLLGGLAGPQPQSASAELRAAAEQTMERVVWMAARKQGLSEARLQLHPAHLGKMDIRLELQGREASLQLTVYHSAVREAVEAMLPRLREQLEGQGLNLGDAWVFDSGSEEKTADESARLAGRDGDAARADDGTDEAETRMQPARRGDGLLDAYA